MLLQLGDHICAIYSDAGHLSSIVAPYLAEGLRRRERCWFLPSGDGPDAVRAALTGLGIDVDAEVARGSLIFAGTRAAYAVRGRFDPEETMAVFSAAIEEALNDGFTGLRAAADMSWVLDVEDGEELVITYEALLKSLFSSCRATGLCLYPRDAMPLRVIGGALATHPIVHASPRGAQHNPFYDPAVIAMPDPVDAQTVESRLAHLAR